MINIQQMNKLVDRMTIKNGFAVSRALSARGAGHYYMNIVIYDKEVPSASSMNRVLNRVLASFSKAYEKGNAIIDERDGRRRVSYLCRNGSCECMLYVKFEHGNRKWQVHCRVMQNVYFIYLIPLDLDTPQALVG